MSSSPQPESTRPAPRVTVRRRKAARFGRKKAGYRVLRTAILGPKMPKFGRIRPRKRVFLARIPVPINAATDSQQARKTPPDRPSQHQRSTETSERTSIGIGDPHHRGGSDEAPGRSGAAARDDDRVADPPRHPPPVSRPAAALSAGSSTAGLRESGRAAARCGSLRG